MPFHLFGFAPDARSVHFPDVHANWAGGFINIAIPTLEDIFRFKELLAPSVEYGKPVILQAPANGYECFVNTVTIRSESVRHVDGKILSHFNGFHNGILTTPLVPRHHGHNEYAR